MAKRKTPAQPAQPAAKRQEHRHVLVAQRGNYRTLVCAGKGCKYQEYWNGTQYVPFLPAAQRSAAPTRSDLQRQSADAIRPVSLWGDLRP